MGRGTHREERYAATALLGLHGVDGALESTPLMEHMVRTGRWWDSTDELAHRVAALHDIHPARAAALARAWSTDADMWMRRLAIISKLGRGDRLDPLLLAEVIEPNRTDTEFFSGRRSGGHCAKTRASHPVGCDGTPRRTN